MDFSSLKTVILISNVQFNFVNIGINQLSIFIIYFHYKSNLYLQIYFSLHLFTYSCTTVAVLENFFLYFSSKTYVVGTLKNRLTCKLTGKKIITILRS